VKSEGGDVVVTNWHRGVEEEWYFEMMLYLKKHYIEMIGLVVFSQLHDNLSVSASR